MLQTIYLETSIVSYLVAQPSRDLVTAANQRSTIEWWASEHEHFSLFVSELVLREITQGDAEAAARRLAVVERIPVLELTDQALSVARALLAHGAIPTAATADALHIAIAAVHRIDYLLTWNYRHIANAAMRTRIDRTCRETGVDPPVLCTPVELLGG